MYPAHIAPFIAPSSVRRALRARRALLPLLVGSCALPLTSARAQTPPVVSPVAEKTPISVAPPAATPSAATPSAATPSAATPVIAGAVDANAGGAAPLKSGAPVELSASATSPLTPSLRLAQLRPKDTEAPATPPEAVPNKLKVPIGPDLPPVGEPAAPPPDTSTPPPRVAQPPGSPVFGDSPDQPAVIGDVRAAEGREISQVTVVGSRVVPNETILALVRSQPGAAFSVRQVQFDIGNIGQLGSFGSVQAQVTPDLTNPNKVVLTYIVIENRVITAFKFINNASVKSEDLIPVLASKVGTILNLNSVRMDVAAIEKLYREKGFSTTIQSGGVNQSDDGTLVFDIPEATISKINIIGLKKTRESLVRRQIRVKPGDVFNGIKVRQDANRLNDTNFFDSIEPNPQDDPDKPGAVILNFVFRERRTGQFTTGLGFDSRSKLSGFVTLSESNLRGTGQSGFASIETGSQRNYELGTGNRFIGDKNASYDVSIYRRSIFRQPNSINRLLNRGTTTNGNGTITDSNGNQIVIPNNSTLQEERTGGRVNFTRPLDYNRRRTLIFGYRNERAQASLRNFNGSVLGGTTETSQNIDSLLSRGTVSAGSVGFLHDSRDLQIDPSTGSRESLVLEQAFKLLGGNTNFTKFDLDLRRYLPVIASDNIGAPAKLVVAGRVVLGRSVNQLPIFEQYYIGGTETVRGYNTEQQFGDNQLYGNLELRYRFQPRITGVLFADSGTAYGGRFSTGNSINLLTSFGIGVRLVTPIGPIRLDYGFGRNGGRTHFGIGPTF